MHEGTGIAGRIQTVSIFQTGTSATNSKWQRAQCGSSKNLRRPFTRSNRVEMENSKRVKDADPRFNGDKQGAVMKTTSQNLWPRINWNHAKCTFKKPTRSAFFFFSDLGQGCGVSLFRPWSRLRRQPRNFENVTLVARRREHSQVFLTIFLVAQLPPTRGVLVHKNSLASGQRCRHSVEPRALTCPFKQSNLSAWSYQNM